MEFWEDDRKYHYQPNQLFVGRSNQENIVDLGITTERHAVTIAGAGAGKGACVIIPNLKRWAHNALVIDPKGEAAAETYQDRIALGQSVHVIDPFSAAKVPHQIRAGFNPLETLDIESRTIGLQARVIADGLVKRTDPKHALWDDSAVTILAGLIVFVKIAEENPEDQTLVRVREILRSKQVNDAFEIMSESPDCGGIMQAAAAVMDDEQGSAFLSGARRHTQWLDFPDFADCLSQSTFSLSDLKHGNTSIYLVLPAEMLSESGGFLRMFVRCAIQAMQKQEAGEIRDKQCLFILDEIYQLGKMDEIQKSMGLMRGYGLQIWSIFQDIGQLRELYGKEGEATFFGNSDLHQYFGNTDPETLEHISKRLGEVRLDEIERPPDAPDGMGAMEVGPQGSMNIGSHVSSLGGLGKKTGTRAAFGIAGGLISAVGGGMAKEQAEGVQRRNATKQAKHQQQEAEFRREMDAYQHDRARVGAARHSPNEVAELVQKTGDGVARAMINLVYGSKPLYCLPAPYFSNVNQAVHMPNQSHRRPKIQKKSFLEQWDAFWGNFDKVMGAFFVGGIFGIAVLTIGIYIHPDSQQEGPLPAEYMQNLLPWVMGVTIAVGYCWWHRAGLWKKFKNRNK